MVWVKSGGISSLFGVPMKALFETIMVLAFWFVGSSASAYAQSTSKIFLNDADRARYNENVVGLVTGSPGGKYMPLGADMARVFDERGRRGLRIVVSVGYGSVQNIDDLLNLKGIDLAIVQADVLDAFRRDPSTYEQLRRKMRYLTRLHREEIHILARGRVPNLAALDRKRISVGLPGSGTRITARLLFERIGIKPIESETGPDEARAQLIAGEIDAWCLWSVAVPLNSKASAAHRAWRPTSISSLSGRARPTRRPTKPRCFPPRTIPR